MQTGYLPSRDDIAFYWEHGYWIAPVLFDQARIETIRAAMERVYAGELDDGRTWPFLPPILSDDPSGIRTTLFSWYVNKEIRALAFDRVLTDIAAALMGVERVRIWQDQSIWKPGDPQSKAGDAGNIGFHQDFAYWQDSSTTNMVSANVALQDTTTKNGALRVFDGSHKLGLLDNADGFFNTDLATLQRRFAAETGVPEETVLDLKAGQVSFHHSLTVHGSGPNISPSPRMVSAPAYMPDETYFRVEGQPACPHSDLLGPDRRHGTPFDGEYFPLIRDG